MKLGITFICLAFALAACKPAEQPISENIVDSGFRIVGTLESARLDEASGMQAGTGGVFFLHNDEGDDLFAIDASGRHLGRMHVKKAKNKDWEDITRVPGENGPLLVIGDIGNKHRTRKSLKLYFLEEPSAADFKAEVRPVHETTLRLPGKATDLEAMAYDPSSGMVLFISKPDQPPHLYGIALDRALAEEELTLQLLGQVHGLRPPSQKDVMMGFKRGLRVSQPTGMDISADGRLAAVITYRSLYLWRRQEGESWIEAFQRQPLEYLGPPGLYEEAVSFSEDEKSIYVTSERRPAPLSKLELP
jgi:hypothetical protein